MDTTLTDADRTNANFRAGYLSSAIAGAIADLETDPTATNARRVAASLRDTLDTCRLPGPDADRVRAAQSAADGRRMTRRWARDDARIARMSQQSTTSR